MIVNSVFIVFKLDIILICTDLDGKKAVVAMETGDCDAAVDAALHALKTSGRSAAGLYLIVQDSLLEDITWRMKDRLKSSCPGGVLDSTTDFSDGQEFKGPQPVLDYFQSTKLDVCILLQCPIN